MNPDVPAVPSAPAPPSRRRVHPRRRHRLLPYAGGVALVALLVVGLWPQPVAVETASARVGALRATVNEEGQTRLRHRYLVSAPVSGQLRRGTLDPGDPVVAGETVVAVIDALPPAMLDARVRAAAEARRDAAQAHLQRAQDAHRFAANERRRFEQLYAARTVSVQELEAVQWRELSGARELAAAESAVRLAEAELAEFSAGADAGSDPAEGPRPVEVKAPASGRVLRVFEQNARPVAASTPLLELGDATELEVVIDVLSRDAAAIVPGTPVELDQWGGSVPLQARVRRVEPGAFTKVSALGVEEQRVNVIAELVTPPDQRLGLGDRFRVEARIIVWQAEGVLQVPAGALFRQGSDWAVFVLEAGRARGRAVKAGRSSGQDTQILEGLQAGETVILYPGDRIRDGQRVRPVKI